MKKLILSGVLRITAIAVALVLLAFLYAFYPRKIDLVIVNHSGADITGVTVVACKKIFKFPLIKNEGFEKTQFSPNCEGAYDVSYLNGSAEMVSSSNMGYITTHIYAEDTIELFNKKARYIQGDRLL